MPIRDEILARMYVMLTLLALVPAAVGLQVVRVGLVDAENLKEAGDRQTARVDPIPAMRGAIVDRKGRTLAVNTARFDIAVDPSVPGFAGAAETLYASLANATGRPTAYFRRRVRTSSSERYALLARGLDTTQLADLDRSVPGLIVQEGHSRTYNYGRIGSHVLGHVGAALEGLAGLEQFYDRDLTGTAGRRDMVADRLKRRRPAADGEFVLPDHGATVVTTIDLVLQSILEEELAAGTAYAGAKWATAVAMDPKTGAILAMANAPTYDPHQAGAFGFGARRNRAIADEVEPGSTFKLVTAVSALEQGLVSMSDTVDTGNGTAIFQGRPVRDTRGYGPIPFSRVIAVSSNIGSARVAERGTKGGFYQTARAFGFGMDTGIDLPGEEDGLLERISEWKGSTLQAMSRGYGVAATPLQLLNAYAALANGGLLMRPHVVKEIRDVRGETIWRAEPDSIRRVMTQETAGLLLPAFEEVVTDGTAKKAAIPGVRVAGKTGTAWKVVNGAYSSGHSRATFVGFFPAEDPVVALLVMMDEPRVSTYGGDVSAPVFAAAGRRWLPTLFEDRRPAALAEADTVRVPQLMGLPPTVAERRILAAGLETSEFPQAVAAVSKVTPVEGSNAALRERIRVSMQEASVDETMPDLTGWTVRDAAFWLRERGVDVRVEGTGAVRGQLPAAGVGLPSIARLRAGD
ncbi:MAG: PASTA domain-containing protein [Rhodothermales bacterium]|nr:PASTA domain-containing protein [Rhodothermales bacterium]MBO6778875.1 PASTA domain-containing protein [Rhodothermales bacterium]